MLAPSLFPAPSPRHPYSLTTFQAALLKLLEQIFHFRLSSLSTSRDCLPRSWYVHSDGKWLRDSVNRVMKTVTREKGSLKAEITTVNPSVHWSLFLSSWEVALWVIGGFAENEFVRIFQGSYSFRYLDKLKKSQQAAILIIYTQHQGLWTRFQISLRADMCSVMY